MAGITRETSVFTKSQTSFSGADIQLYINGDYLWTAQSVSYSITREKAPIYILGSANPVAFSRGKRGIAGTLIMSSVSTDAMGKMLDNSEFAAKSTDLAYYMTNHGTIDNYRKAYSAPGGNTTQSYGSVRAVAPIYYDQLLPFDIVVMGANEYFALAQMVIYGVEILTMGSGLSIDDTSNESTFSFVAQHITRWKPIQRPDKDFGFDQAVGFNPATAQSTFAGSQGTGGFQNYQ